MQFALIDPALQLLATLLVFMLFLTAVWHKLASMVAFQDVLSGYQIFPNSLLKVIAPLVVMTEVSTLVLLLVAPEYGRLLALALLSGYTLLIVITLARGIRRIDCGCGWGKTSIVKRLSWWDALRNIGLICVTGVLFLPVLARTLTIIDFVSIASALIVLCIAVLAFNSLPDVKRRPSGASV